jgi:hypothetical protein
MRRFIPGIALSLALGVMGGAGAVVAHAQTDGAPGANFGSCTDVASGGTNCIGISCSIHSLEGNYDQNFPGNFISGTGTAVIARNAASITFVCHAQDPGVIPFMESGFPCHLGPFGDTSDSRLVWTPSGQGTLICHRP